VNGSSESNAPSVVVVGAGIAGLATAYRLMRLAAERGMQLNLTVLEAEDRPGGNIESMVSDGFVLERGPDSIITEKPWGVALCREVGLEERLIPTDPNHRGSFVVRGRRLYPVPDGFHLLAPSKIRPFVTSRLFSIGGKLRMACEPFIPARRESGDESLASFVRRRLGREALDRIAQPMVGGVYTADPEQLSLLATMPRFLDLERKHGSVIRGMMKAARQARSAVGSARGPRYDLFVALEGGLEELPRRLLELLPKGTLRTGAPVARVRREQRRWIVDTAGDSMSADAVCLAVPAHAAARILTSEAPKLAAELEPIPYASAATVNLIYRREQIGHSLGGFGFVVPAVEKRSILACTFGSQKYRGRAPAGLVILRAFVGGAMFPEKFDLDDDELIAATIADVSELLSIRGEPARVLLSRYHRSMAQYHLGHLDRVERIERLIVTEPGLALAGNAYRGTGIPDCIHSGETAAARLIEHLAHVRKTGIA